MIDLAVLSKQISANMRILLEWLIILWGIHIVNAIVRYRLLILGIYPRKLWGLPGIVFAPFLHGNFGHLFFNSIPLFVLAHFMLISTGSLFYPISGLIIVLGGFGVWLIGRSALHVGASGLIMGYFGFLLTMAYQQQSGLALLLVGVCLYYFGGLVSALVPSSTRESWEGHLLGFLAGVTAALLFLSGWFSSWF
ncbi:MAG: rhomboid family intramembrane serine protease [Legionellales bacterium]|nr:rhomboid family intramembrane serine protease [Legionellales bacterium]